MGAGGRDRGGLGWGHTERDPSDMDVCVHAPGVGIINVMHFQFNIQVAVSPYSYVSVKCVRED